MPELTNNGNNNDTLDTLKTLSPDGEAPKTRIGTGQEAYQIWNNLWLADTDRAKRRTLVQGLVDGNPPYNPADLVAAGVSYRCNVNWGTAKAFLDNASGAFYDLFSESPTYVTVKLKKYEDKVTDENQVKWSNTVTEHFDWLLRYDDRFD